MGRQWRTRDKITVRKKYNDGWRGGEKPVLDRGGSRAASHHAAQARCGEDQPCGCRAALGRANRPYQKPRTVAPKEAMPIHASKGTGITVRLKFLCRRRGRRRRAQVTAAPSEDRKQLIENNLFPARGLTRPRPIADPGKAFRIIPKIHRPRHAEMT